MVEALLCGRRVQLKRREPMMLVSRQGGGSSVIVMLVLGIDGDDAQAQH
jgi:hypothetical protein